MTEAADAHWLKQTQLQSAAMLPEVMQMLCLTTMVNILHSVFFFQLISLCFLSCQYPASITIM